MRQETGDRSGSRGQFILPAIAALSLLGVGAGGVAARQDGNGMPAAAPNPGHSPEQGPALPEAQHPPAPVLVPPKGATVELLLKISRADEIKSLLLRSGAAEEDAAGAAAIVADAVLQEDAEVAVLLGDRVAAGKRRLERLTIEATRSMRLIVGRDRSGQLRLVREFLGGDATPRKFGGKVGSSLFWSLRAAGVPPDPAGEYVEALSTRPDFASRIRPGDRFELVVDHWRSGKGEDRPGPLLYAGLHRADGRSLNLVRWTIAGSAGWYEPGKSRQTRPGFEQPVAGRVSSRFGRRIHPILRIGRFHEGVDYSARRGTPVTASADGAVVAAGWNGGHGRQVRIAHGDGLSTSYSHLSRIAAEPGARVRRGQIIGFVGSSGFSTGPHLHFEVRRNGRPIDPLGLRQSAAETIGASDLAALQARLQQLRSI